MIRPFLRWGLALLVAVLALGSRAGAVDLADQLTPQAKASIDSGLAFLASQQRPDGGFLGDYGQGSGVVGAVAIAFMAAGHVPGEGQYGHVTGKATQYLLNGMQTNGLLYRPESGGPPMYNHGLATLALAEVWGMTGDPRIRPALQKAVDLICSTQNAKGGWRYQPKIADDDLSVTVMQLMALRACRDGGISVPPEVIAAGIGYVKSCANPKRTGKDGGFSYRPDGASHIGCTGAGVTSLQVAGDLTSSEIQDGVEYLLASEPVGARQEPNKEFLWYNCYYATMGIYQAQSLGAWGRQAWAQWYPAMVRYVLANQKANGEITGRFGCYSTAMGVVILAIPNRYLPLFQR